MLLRFDLRIKARMTSFACARVLTFQSAMADAARVIWCLGFIWPCSLLRSLALLTARVATVALVTSIIAVDISQKINGTYALVVRLSI
jgi:hypothetical protein